MDAILTLSGIRRTVRNYLEYSGETLKTVSFISLFLSFIAWAILPPLSFANEIIYVDEYNPPFMYAQNNTATGIYPAIIRALFARLNEKVTVEAVPWKRAIANLDNGKGGVGGIYKTKPRLMKYDYTDELFLEKIMIYVHKGKTFAFSGINDLKDKQLGIIRGWSYGDQFDEAKKTGLFNIEEQTDDSSNFRILAAGHIDALIAIKESAERIIDKENLSDKVEALDKPLAIISTHIAFSKQSNKKALITRINQTLSLMRQDGSYSKVLNQAISKESAAKVSDSILHRPANLKRLSKSCKLYHTW